MKREEDCKISKEDAKQIRKFYKKGFTVSEIATWYGVSMTYIGDIVKGYRR